MLPPMPPGVPMPEEVLEEVREECLQECRDELESADPDRRAEGRRCVEEPDCEEFMRCVEALRP